MYIYISLSLYIYIYIFFFVLVRSLVGEPAHGAGHELVPEGDADLLRCSCLFMVLADGVMLYFCVSTLIGYYCIVCVCLFMLIHLPLLPLAGARTRQYDLV